MVGHGGSAGNGGHITVNDPFGAQSSWVIYAGSGGPWARLAGARSNRRAGGSLASHRPLVLANLGPFPR
jgi:hypothetical protein